MRVRPAPLVPHLVALILGCLAGLGLPARAAPARWLKLEAGDFVVYSNAPEKQVVECAVRYAAFRRAFSELFMEPGASLPPSLLLLFRSDTEFRDHVPPATDRDRFNVVNYSAEIDGTSLNAFALQGDRDRALALTFEFETVSSLRRVGYHAPIWMTQGAGAVLSTLTVKKGKCLVGDPGDRSIDREYLWPRFFEIGESSPAYNDPAQLAHYLGQAWSLMHWIVLKDGAAHSRFADLALRLRTAPALDAVEAVMATPQKDFNRAISQHHSHLRTPREIPFDESAERARLHPVPAVEAEVLVQKANLFAAAQMLPQSDAHLDRAIALAPDLPLVKEAEARRMFREGRPADAVRLYREAIAAGSLNSAAYAYSASARLDDSTTGGRDVAGDGGSQADVAVEELRRAIKLNPGSAEAYRLLGRAFFVLPTITDDHLSELSQGVVSGEDGQPIRYYHALLQERLGHVDAYHAELRAIARDPLASESNRRRALQRLTGDVVERDAARIEKLAAAGNFAEARAIVAAAAATQDDEQAAGDYQRFDAWLDEFEAWDHVRALRQASRWPELRQAAEAFVKKFPTSRRVKDARRLATLAQQHEAKAADAATPP